MKLYIKQKIFSIGDKYTVKDEFDQIYYYVEGQIFSIGAKLRIYDQNRTEKIFIKRKVFTFMPEYEFYRGEELIAIIQKKFKMFKNEFTVESKYGNYVLDGNFLGMDLSITKDGKEVAIVMKKWFTWGDSYEIDILDDSDIDFLTALVIVIDNCLHNENQ